MQDMFNVDCQGFRRCFPLYRLFKHLEENPGKYDAPEAKPAEPAEPEAVIEEKVLVEEQRIRYHPIEDVLSQSL